MSYTAVSKWWESCEEWHHARHQHYPEWFPQNLQGYYCNWQFKIYIFEIVLLDVRHEMFFIIFTLRNITICAKNGCIFVTCIPCDNFPMLHLLYFCFQQYSCQSSSNDRISQNLSGYNSSWYCITVWLDKALPIGSCLNVNLAAICPLNR